MMKLKRIPKLVICMLLAISLFASPVFMSGTAAAAEQTPEELAAGLRLVEEDMTARADAAYEAWLLEMEELEIDKERLADMTYEPSEPKAFPFSQDAEDAVTEEGVEEVAEDEAVGDAGLFAVASFAAAIAPSLTEADGYFQIGTAEELNGIRDIPEWQTKNYILTDDIDLTAIPWTPLPGEFSGHFDGAGHIISGIYIAGETLTGNIGLFEQIGTEGRVSDLNLADVNINAPDADKVGALAGVNAGTIENCAIVANQIRGKTQVGGLVGINSGTIDFSSAYGEVVGSTVVGGLIGENSGMVNKSGFVGAVFAAAGLSDVSVAGGFVGLQAGGTIVDGYAMANPVVGGNSVGGFAGQADADSVINQSYSASYLAGVKGDSRGSNGNGSLLNNRRGFVGNDNGGSYSVCYYELTPLLNTAVSDSTISPEIREGQGNVRVALAKIMNPNGIMDIDEKYIQTYIGVNGDLVRHTWGTNDAVTKTQEAYAGLDFESVWELNSEGDYTFYPTIQGLDILGTVIDKPISVDSVADLMAIAPYSSLVYMLDADIELDYEDWEYATGGGATSNPPSTRDELLGDGTDPDTLTPEDFNSSGSGNYKSYLDYFAGYFNGNGKLVTMKYNNGSRNDYNASANSSSRYATLFGSMVGAYAADITVDGMAFSSGAINGVYKDITARNNKGYGQGSFFGMFSGLSRSIAENCHVQNIEYEYTGATRGYENAGFAITIGGSKVYNCTVTDITMQADSSQLFGQASGFAEAISGGEAVYGYPAEVVDCHVYGGTISGYQTSGFVGSLGAFFLGKIENCTTNANVTGKVGVGGFIASSLTSTLLNSMSQATLGSVIGCGATGVVIGSYSVGGFAGELVGPILFSNCYATGDVFASGYAPKSSSLSFVGGFLGNGSSNFENCFATGDVTGRNGAGGFVGLWNYAQHYYPKHYYMFGMPDREIKVLVEGVGGCFATGDVYATDVNIGNNHSGGFVGYADIDSVLADAYATGDVYGYKGLGGFAGTVDSTAIMDCYSTGALYAEAEGGGGGFAGEVRRNGNLTVQFLNCIYDIDKSDAERAIGNIPAGFVGARNIYGYPEVQPELAEIRGLTTEQMQNQELISSTSDTYTGAHVYGGNAGHPIYVDVFYENDVFPWAFKEHSVTYPLVEGENSHNGYEVREYDGSQYWYIDENGESPAAYNRNTSDLMKQLLSLSASQSVVEIGGIAEISLDKYVGIAENDLISWGVDGTGEIDGAAEGKTVKVKGTADGIARINVYINNVKYDNLKLVVGNGGEVAGLKAIFLTPAPIDVDNNQLIDVNPTIKIMFTLPVDMAAFYKADGSLASYPAHWITSGDSAGDTPDMNYQFSDSGTMLTITLQKDLSYGAPYTLQLSNNFKSKDSGLSLTGGMISFNTRSFDAPTVTVEGGAAVSGGTEYTVSADYVNEINFDDVSGGTGVYTKAKVYIVVRSGLGARENSGGEMVFYAEKELSLFTNQSGGVESTFVLPDGTGDFYVDVYTMSPNGADTAAEAVHVTKSR